MLAQHQLDFARRHVLAGPPDYVAYPIDEVEEAVLTAPGPFSDLMSSAVERVTGQKPDLSTTGGTSDARFIKDFCPVAEFGLISQTMHKIDERVAIADLENLTDIYETVLNDYFAS